ISTLRLDFLLLCVNKPFSERHLLITALENGMRNISTLLLALSVASMATAQVGYSVSSNGNDHLYAIDLPTGVATDLGVINFGDAEGLSHDGSGNLFALGGSEQNLWNITTPPGTLIGATGGMTGSDSGLDWFNGTMYAMSGAGGASTLYTINLGTGAATAIGGDVIFMDSLAIDPNGNAFGIDGVFSDSLYSVNLTTGAATLVGALGGDVSVQTGSDFDNAGNDCALTSNGEIFTANTTAGALTYVNKVTENGENVAGFAGLSIDPVPELATMTKLGLGG